MNQDTLASQFPNWSVKGLVENPSLPGSVWVDVIVHIRDNTTGDIRKLLNKEILEPGEPTPSVHSWVDGNYSCNCNRSAFFKSAGQEPILDYPACGDGAYSINLQNPVTGGFYYREFQVESVTLKLPVQTGELFGDEVPNVVSIKLTLADLEQIRQHVEILQGSVLAAARATSIAYNDFDSEWFEYTGETDIYSLNAADLDAWDAVAGEALSMDGPTRIIGWDGQKAYLRWKAYPRKFDVQVFTERVYLDELERLLECTLPSTD